MVCRLTRRFSGRQVRFAALAPLNSSSVRRLQIAMNSFDRQYIDAFLSVGRSLSDHDAMPEGDLLAAEHRLGVRIPEALVRFYSVAGRAADFMDHYDHLLPPKDWSAEANKLLFLAENQAVVLYGAGLEPLGVKNPPVFMCTNQPPFEWHEVCGSTSEFLEVMLRWECAFGGAMAHTATGQATPSLVDLLKAKAWRNVGEVNEMRAYSKHQRALCHVQWSDGWRVFAGATSEADLKAIGEELGIELEEEL